jgi:hypothetical protein
VLRNAAIGRGLTRAVLRCSTFVLVRHRAALGGLAALLVLSGAALTIAPFFAAQGPAGPDDSYPGTVMDLKPTYSAILIVLGALIGLFAAFAARLRRPGLAGAVAVLAFAAGFSLDSVQVVIDNSVIYRSYSVFELRGPGPWIAGAASLAAMILAIALTAALIHGRHRSADTTAAGATRPVALRRTPHF